MNTGLVEWIVVLGVGVVMPLVFGHVRRWAAVTAAVVSSLIVPTGPIAAVLATAWLAAAAISLVGALRTARASTVDAVLVARVMAPAFACVAAVAFACSRGNVSLLGIGEPIVQLTAVHFTYAGVGAVALAGIVARTHRIAGAVAVVLTVSAPPIVASGFLVEHPVPQVGGAVLMATGVLATASLQLADAGSATGAARPLLVLSSVTPWIPMALAVAWATSLYAEVPALSIPDMVRIHGTMNAVFVVAGLVARVIEGHLPVDSPIGSADHRPDRDSELMTASPTPPIRTRTAVAQPNRRQRTGVRRADINLWSM